MKINLTSSFSLPRKIIIRIILKTFLLLLCTTTAFSFSPVSGFSQNAKITIDANKMLTVDQVFDLVMHQTDYTFIYQVSMFKDYPKVNLKKGTIKVSDLLDKSLSSGNFGLKFTENNIIVITKNEVLRQAIKGKVTDENGKALAGVTILIKGKLKTNGVSTNADGNFTINAEKGDILIVSMIGFATKEITVTSENISVSLTEKISDLDVVQVIGYGTTTKRESTGAISTIKGDEINLRPVDNVIQALQGQISGLAITSPGSGIGAPQQILIRGKNSITSGTSPLIILDGVIINQNLGALAGSAFYQDGVSVLNSINQNDVESIDVLKDADATAIYGSRGTNGVIIITTKGGKIGEAKISATVSTGVSRGAGIVKRLKTDEYLQFRRDAFAMGNISATSAINPIVPTNNNAPDLTVWSQTAYTDYTKLELDNPASSYNADVSMVGGVKAFNFLTSLSYAKRNDTYLFDPYQERYNGRMRFNHTSKNDKFKLSINTILGIENQKFAQLNIGSSIPTTNTNAPNFELYKADGSNNFATGYLSGRYYNPLPNANIDVFSKTKNTQLSGEMSYEFIKDLVGKAQVSYNSQNNDYKNIYPTVAINVQNTANQVPEARFSNSIYQSINFEPQLTYTKRISKATIAALIGGTLLKQTNNATSVTVTNPASDNFLYNYASGNPTTTSSGSSNTKFNSTFGRLSMDWDKKYFANLTYRRDGSSRFGPANRFGNFGSIGTAWIFSNEELLKESNILSYGKLRASYGTTGNNNIGDNGYLALLTSSSSGSNYQGNPQLDVANVANPDLQWEKTTKYDIGLSLGFFKDRILLNATYYNALTSNLLVQLPLTTQTGFSSYSGNFPGQVENAGLEIDLTTNNLNSTSKLSWKTTFNLTHNKNQLKKYDGLDQSVYANVLQIGRALPSSISSPSYVEFPYHFNGINSANGVPIIMDVDGDGKVNTNDYLRNAAWIGSSTPTTWGGMSNSLGYKNFSLDIFLQMSNGIFTKWNSRQTIGGIYNPSEDIVGNYWMQPGDVSKYPRLITGVAATTTDGRNAITANDQYRSSDASLYKGYYIRLKNVRFSYNLPSKLLSRLKILGSRLYISGENLALYTPGKLDKDPEAFFTDGVGVLRTISAGVQVSF